MPTEVSEIIGRTQRSPVEVRHVGQFQLGRSGRAESDIVLGENWSLYCLDMANETAIFVETLPEADFLASPFMYAEQYNSARRVAKLDFQELPELAANVPQPENLAILMSTGRCGSTLASRIFAQVPGVLSISEPDWPTNLAFARFELEDRLRDKLIASCARLTCKLPMESQTTTVVIKPRSEMMTQAGAYIDQLKGYNGVFLYRDCHGYVNSIYRFAQRILESLDHKRGSEEWNLVRNFTTIGASEAVLDDYFGSEEVVDVVDLMTLAWVLRMGAYKNAPSSEMNVTPIHYNDLNADRARNTQLLLEACGVSAEYTKIALKGFEEDSQAGVRDIDVTKGEPITDRHKSRISELLARWGWDDYKESRLTVPGNQSS